MRLGTRLIERYIIAATLPYFGLALFLLTAILLAQQGSRFAELLGTARAPLGIAAELMLGLLPNVLIFTVPMAMLIGTATGFSRLGSDSELVAMRAAGVGTWRIITPVLLLGLVLAALTLHVGFELAPRAAHMLRQAALRAAIYRLESPVEPRTFNTEMPGKVIYVREGDKARGQWGKVFIHWEEPGGAIRLVTARSGRIDSSDEQSELVLSDAMVTTLPGGMARGEGNPKKAQVITERSAQLRVRDDRLNTGRDALLQRLRGRERELDEMNWRELSAQARYAKDAKAARAAIISLHKRLALCVAPLVFALFGAGLGLRTRRGGRGLGVLLSLLAMIAYYLVSLVGEQLGRAGNLPPAVGAWLANGVALVVGGGLLLIGPRMTWRVRLIPRVRPALRTARQRSPITFSGLLDRSVLRSLCWNFLIAFTSLVAIFLIFTLFELLRFITTSATGTFNLIARYLLFLLPLVIVAMAPMSLLVAVLVTYALMARRSEAIAWWGCGQSIYRLTLPGLIFAGCIGFGVWLMQEKVMPQANQRQNLLRAQIRGGAARAVTPVGRQWLATADAQRVYAYEYEGREGELKSPTIYEFDGDSVHLRRVVAGERAEWSDRDVLWIEQAEVIEMGVPDAGGIRRTAGETIRGAEPPEMFKPLLNTPSEMSIKQLSNYINTLKRRREVASLAALRVALERKRAAPFAPLVLALIGIPFALGAGRRGALTALCVAIGTGLAFWGATSGFQQLGAYGLLPVILAAWAPLVIFAAVGIYVLARART